MRHQYIIVEPEELQILRRRSGDPGAMAHRCKHCEVARIRARGITAYALGNEMSNKPPKCQKRGKAWRKKNREAVERENFLSQLPSDHIYRLQQGFLKSARTYIESLEINGVRFMPGDGLNQHMLNIAIIYHLDEVHMGEQMPEDMIEKVGRGVIDRQLEEVKRQLEEAPVSVPMQVIKIPAGGGIN